MSANIAIAQDNNAKQIMLAVSNVTSGPAAQLGLRLNLGAEAYFRRANKNGELGEHRIKMLKLNDSYEPFKALSNTQSFLAQGEVFAFFNYVGTPTSAAVFKSVKMSGLPFLTPFTGAEFLRNPVTENVFNLRASYYQEAKKQIDYLVKTKGIRKIGLLIQADDFGYAVEKGYLDVLKMYDIAPTVTARYRRNTEGIDTALMLLKQHDVEAVAFVGTYRPMASLINKAYAMKFTPLFVTVSFISSHDLFGLLKYPSQVLVSEVMPDPSSCQAQYCQEFIEDMKNLGIVEVDRIQLEGYLNAYLFTQVAKRCLPQITQRCFLDEISDFSLKSNGLDIQFSSNDHQGLNDVYLNFYSNQLKASN